jgi:hypothetical protein
MKTYLVSALGIVLLVPLSIWSQKLEDTGLCRKTMFLPKGHLISSLSDLSTGSSISCSVTATTRTAKSDQQLLLEPTGFVHTINHRGRTAKIRSLAFLNSDSEKNHLATDSENPHVNQVNLHWMFNKENGSLQSIQTADGKTNCLSQKSSPGSVRISSSGHFDLHACPGAIIADLGVIATNDQQRKTAPLVRNRVATISVSDQGKLLKCKIQIGRLFSYQQGRFETNGKTVIIEKGYDPCFMFATPAFPNLTPVNAIKAFKQRNPRHACVRMERGDESDILKYRKFTPIPEGISVLSGDLNISYSPYPPHILVSKLKKYGQTSQCSLVASVLDKQAQTVSPNVLPVQSGGRQ